MLFASVAWVELYLHSGRNGTNPEVPLDVTHVVSLIIVGLVAVSFDASAILGYGRHSHRSLLGACECTFSVVQIDMRLT